MRRNLFLIALSIIAIFGYSSQALAGSDTADEISLLNGQKNRSSQHLVISPERSEVFSGTTIEKYVIYRSKYNQPYNLANVLWQLEQYKNKWNSFRLTALMDCKIPEQFIKGIFDDFQNPERVLAIKAMIQQSNNRKKKGAEEAKAAALNKTSIMDISSFSSASLSDDSSSAVASVMTHPSGTTATPTLESCATTHDTQLRQRKTAQSTAPTIPSH